MSFKTWESDRALRRNLATPLTVSETAVSYKFVYL